MSDIPLQPLQKLQDSYADERSTVLKQRSKTRQETATETFNATQEKIQQQNQTDDLEKGEKFDLRAMLTGLHEEEQQGGIKMKELDVTWTDLQVLGKAGARAYVETFPETFIYPLRLLKNAMQRRKAHPVKPLLHRFNGIARAGEMILVLGKPGSGCSTFLKTIANQRSLYAGVKGDVLYGNLTHQELKKQFRGEVLYSPEDDDHAPSLTVAQTLLFALKTRTPRARVPGQTRADFQEELLDMLLKMFRIEHTRDTMVGNAFMRGVSGGERKRVSIAELLTSRCTVTCWDNSTKGLDASTALGFAQALRDMTDVYKNTTFVSLYQAGEGVYDLFDKVLVIDSGRQVYFGPAKEARKYFEDIGFTPLPRQTTADYVAGCTDPHSRSYQDPARKHTLETPEQLEDEYYRSSTWKAIEADRQQCKERSDAQTSITFKESVKASQANHAAPYTLSFLQQILAVAQRQYQLKIQDVFGLCVNTGTTVVIALIVGSVFYDLPPNSFGAFNRGGALFLTILFNALTSFSELPTSMMGRGVTYRHKDFAFYRPSTYQLGVILSDIPFQFVNIFLFTIIVYWMVGLYASAGAFFTFLLILITSTLCFMAVFRTLASLCPSFDFASRIAAIIITFLVLYSGYQISFAEGHWWFKWFFYLNPIRYAFAALMENEFGHLGTIPCAPGTGLVPYGPSYTSAAYQACTLRGAVPGETSVSAANYLASFNYSPDELWRDWGIVLAFFVFFLIINCIIVEYVAYGSKGKQVTLYKKSSRKAMSNQVRPEGVEVSAASEKPTAKHLLKSTKVLTWENLAYTVPLPGKKELKLLDDIYGYVAPGCLTALMGSSGAGKTTLLDVLAMRKTIGVVTGDLLMDGLKLDASFQKGTGYCEQLDVHEETATVREALRFSAYLRQKASVTKEEKDQYVEEIIELLELSGIADGIIGSAMTGLNVEERKRVTIGVELASKPELLLFLDEPTSGLDGQSAYNIVRFLNKLAASGQAILCTIHQPNSLLFEHFDRLLLLQKGGQTVYFGKIGKDSEHLNAYLAKNGAPVPDSANTAEFMLEAIGAGSIDRIGAKDWADVWRESDEFQQVKQEIAEFKQQASAKGISTTITQLDQKDMEYTQPWQQQLRLVIGRQNLAFWRRPEYGFTRLWNHVIVALITGFTYYNVDYSVASMQLRIFALFQICVLPALIIAQVEPMYIMSRMIFIRESSSKMYSQLVFTTSMLIAEMPYSLLCAVLFFVCIYYPVGLQHVTYKAGFQFLMILITELFSVTLGQMVASLSPSIYIASIANPFLIIIFAVFCGVTAPYLTLNVFYRSWVYWADPFRYLIAAMITTEFHDLPVICDRGELGIFNPPPLQTCGDYMLSFFADGATGHLNNPLATFACEYCPYSSGAEYLGLFNIAYSDRWRDFGILTMFTVTNILVTLLAARWLNFARR